MKQAKVVSVNVFARRFGLTRSAVIDRIRAGTLVSQYDTRKKLYSIPMMEVDRMRSEIIAEGHGLERQRTNAQSLASWLDTLIAKAAIAVQDAEAELIGQTAGTKAQRDAQELLDKAKAAYEAEWELQKPYIVLARRIEKAGEEFLNRFKGDGDA
jgi:hypothetical protein